MKPPMLPKPYASTIEAYREIIPALLRQVRDPECYVRRRLPASARAVSAGADAGPLAGPGMNSVRPRNAGGRSVSNGSIGAAFAGMRLKEVRMQ